MSVVHRGANALELTAQALPRAERRRLARRRLGPTLTLTERATPLPLTSLGAPAIVGVGRDTGVSPLGATTLRIAVRLAPWRMPLLAAEGERREGDEEGKESAGHGSPANLPATSARPGTALKAPDLAAPAELERLDADHAPRPEHPAGLDPTGARGCSHFEIVSSA
jgi:hypothetical protein